MKRLRGEIQKFAKYTRLLRTWKVRVACKIAGGKLRGNRMSAESQCEWIQRKVHEESGMKV